MSKKALKMAGRHPMFLAIIMATLALGLLFSGWWTPVSSNAQTGGGNPQSNVENTNCVATTNAWSGTCPSLITSGSVEPSTIYDPWKTAPTMPTNIVAPSYTTNNIFTQVITYSSTNCDAVTNTENVTYSVSGIMWTNFSSPYTNFPSVLTNTFTAQAYVIVTSSDINLCSSPGIVFIGDTSSDGGNASFAQANDAQANAGFSLTTWVPYGLIHKCVNTQPEKKPGVDGTGVWRTEVGVGEKVNLSIHGLPSGTAVHWDFTDGSIDHPDETACVWTAPYTTGIDPNAPPQVPAVLAATKSCTITATFSIDGKTIPRLVTFTVYRPTTVNMKLHYALHTINTCYIGELTDVYLAPANVNFSAVTIQEEAVDPIYGTTIDIIGTGVYNGRIPHGTSVSLSMSSNVDDQLGTKGSINPFDHVEFNPSSFLGITSTAMGEGGLVPDLWATKG